MLLAAFGCGLGGESEVEPPQVDPEQAATKALEQYDKNSDDALSKEELAACPGILWALPVWDANGDGKVDRAELQDHLTAMYSSGVGLMGASCSVTRRGRTYPGAIVRYVPEAFLGDAVQTAQGITDPTGSAAMAVADDKLPADQRGLNMAQVGVYKVEIELAPGEPAESKEPLGVQLDPTARLTTSPTFNVR